MSAPEPAPIGYVLKGYPRLSELFIASEIERLEQLGVDVRLFVLKRSDESLRHPVVERIAAVPRYLPAMTSLSGTAFPRWLVENVPAYAGALGRVAVRAPGGLLAAAALALAQSWRARKRRVGPPRKLYAKEFLQAVAVADGLTSDRSIAHVHAHFAHGATTVAWLAARIAGVPFSFTGHAKDIYEESLNPGGLLRRKLGAARFVVTCTEANRRHLLALRPDARVHCIYHGLNSEFSRLVLEPDAPPAAAEPFRVLAVGRLVRKKGFDLLLRAVADLRGRGVDAQLAIVGPTDEHEQELRSLVAELGLAAAVDFAGSLGQDALRERYRAATVVCLPCRVLETGDRDGIPNVLVEALACGTPVVSTDISGIPELIEDRVTGLLVPPEDVGALVAALDELASDRRLAADLGRRGRAVVRERFDGDALAAELAQLLRTAEVVA